jgi:hypothetical protein
MSDRTRKLETLLATRKLGKLIRMLLPKCSKPLNFNMLLDVEVRSFKSEVKTDRAVAARMVGNP